MTETADTNTYVYLVGSLTARPVKIGTTSDMAGRLRDLQAGSPVQLHVMWQTHGGRVLERALHQRFQAYRQHGEWFDFGEDHPVALIATFAVGLGYREYPSRDLPGRDILPTSPQVTAARRLARILREAFARAGDPELMTLVDLVAYLRSADPEMWKEWDQSANPLAMAGRTIASTFRAARFEITPVRAQVPGRPTALQLKQVARAAL